MGGAGGARGGPVPDRSVPGGPGKVRPPGNTARLPLCDGCKGGVEGAEARRLQQQLPPRPWPHLRKEGR
jgi:hypothetical protein